jgi:hypothetical protein
MPYSDYQSGREETKHVAALLRSLMQDVTKDFKKETIDVLFPDKKIDNINIGEVSSRWVKHIICSLQNQTELQIKLMMIVWMKYHNDENIDKDPIWHLIWMRIGLPLFSDKINALPAVGKVSPMGSLEKPSGKRRDIRTVNW